MLAWAQMTTSRLLGGKWVHGSGHITSAAGPTRALERQKLSRECSCLHPLAALYWLRGALFSRPDPKPPSPPAPPRTWVSTAKLDAIPSAWTSTAWSSRLAVK